jgi:hypothetical protein
LETNILTIPFLLFPLFCMWYIFRSGGEEESNPIWGNIVASGMGVIISAMVVLWFIQGGVSSVPVVLESSSFIIPDGTTVAEAQAIQSGIAPNSVLGEGGSGMFVASSISTVEYVNGTTAIVHTYDTVIQQYQDIGVALLYALFGVILSALFLWSILTLKDQLREEREEEDNPENWGS